MSVPGLPTGSASGALSASYASSANNIDLYLDVGSPTGDVVVFVHVQPGVVIGSVDAAIASMDMDGFSSESSIRLVNKGRIAGKGGDGGRGANIAIGEPNFVGAGGGGGAGTNPGLGGAATAPATAGTAGTTTVNGVHGTTTTTASPPAMSNETGEDGGDAIVCGSAELVIDNSAGEIWGGGGGGYGAFGLLGTLENGGDGGGLGEDGELAVSIGTGFAGFAVRGSDVTFLSGESSPNVEGQVGI